MYRIIDQNYMPRLKFILYLIKFELEHYNFFVNCS